MGCEAYRLDGGPCIAPYTIFESTREDRERAIVIVKVEIVEVQSIDMSVLAETDGRSALALLELSDDLTGQYLEALLLEVGSFDLLKVVVLRDLRSHSCSGIVCQ